MNENRPPLAVFDLCDTLVAENTTVGFLRFYAEATGTAALKRALSRWTSRRSPFFYLGAVAHRLAGVDLGRRRMLAALAGEPRDSLREQAEGDLVFASGIDRESGNRLQSLGRQRPDEVHPEIQDVPGGVCREYDCSARPRGCFHL